MGITLTQVFHCLTLYHTIDCNFFLLHVSVALKYLQFLNSFIIVLLVQPKLRTFTFLYFLQKLWTIQ